VKDGKFEVGDNVRFLVGSGGYPRWDGGLKRGHPPFSFYVGTVMQASGESFSVSYGAKGQMASDTWIFWYEHEKTAEEGWPELVGALGATNMCECGGAKLGLTHSHWCPAHTC
jgi:hypothetical protein